MENNGPLYFAYAKACGITGKSLIGRDKKRLIPINRLADFDRLLFPTEPLDVPEKELSAKIEQRIIDRSLDAIIRVFAAWTEVPAILVTLLRSVELSELKTLLAAQRVGDRIAPPHSELGRFGQIRWALWPNVPAMLAGSDYAWILDDASKNEGQLAQEIALDRWYYRHMWRAISPLPGSPKLSLRALIGQEIQLKNAIWALRLRLYYDMGESDIRPYLIDIDGEKLDLIKEALVVLQLPLEEREAWEKWTYSELVNTEAAGRFWKIDPVYVQNRAAVHLANRARFLFRQKPFTIDAIAAWIRLLQFEEGVLTAIAEGLALGMPIADVLNSLEAS